MQTFKFNRTLDVLYLYTRGQQLGGNVVITQVDTEEDPDVVYVDVTAQHSTKLYLHAVSVCSLERAAGEQGVAIFVSHSSFAWGMR
jgi:hypothetical protein